MKVDQFLKDHEAQINKVKQVLCHILRVLWGALIYLLKHLFKALLCFLLEVGKIFLAVFKNIFDAFKKQD